MKVRREFWSRRDSRKRSSESRRSTGVEAVRIGVTIEGAGSKSATALKGSWLDPQLTDSEVSLGKLFRGSALHHS